MSSNQLKRRKFMRMFTGMTAAFCGTSLMSEAAQSAPSVLQEAQQKIDNLKIVDLKYLRMEFPGTLPVKWNSIITSGGGAPSMTQMEIHTDQGIIGRSLPKGPKSIAETIFKKIKGENPFFIERIWDRMYRDNRKPVAKGDYIKAMGSIDMAIWDIIGKALGLPVYRVLGGFQDKIRVYAAGGYYRQDKSIKDLADEMQGYVKDGFRAVKMKVGGADFNTDIERVKTVRDAIGPDIDLLLDANNKWYAFDAIRFGRAVEKFNPFWFEEPVVPDDFAGCAEVKNALDIPIVAGENEYTRWGCRDLIVNNSADILNLDTVNAGGITEYRKIAALASAFHIPIAPHGDPHMAVHLVASIPNALIMETYPGVYSQYNPALKLFPVKDGYIQVPNLPGLGIDPDPADVKKYSK
ncbi:mandelate racemase/muconate lactonizing enzyme family protein [candidate division KSB1 bacterium]|nr:mandelate racemase/muconate lactonizing enzyme family protein [candidate division KSB1 bacterium]